ncbi:MAG: TRAP transporter large permease subunit [Rhizobiaceae bacterium]|nr:TRAP transporter large permease subunit [Rhizobiaceae bacterium]
MAKFLQISYFQVIVAALLPAIFYYTCLFGGAGVVVGIMNITGLAQSISFILTQAGASGGLLVMLILTEILAFILGMGMPSTAINVVLATVIAPSLVRMGVEPIAAHLFIFYFGVMSFLTPPVAVSSYVAAGMANASMWTTSWVGTRYSAVAFVLPFLWWYEPALLLDGSWLEIAVISATTLSAVIIFARDQSFFLFAAITNEWLRILALAAFSLAIAVLPIYFGTDSVLAIATAISGLILAFIPEKKVTA